MSNVRACLLVLCAFVCLTALATADTITISGNITQSTQDGTGPAENNPSLNNIATLDPYTVTLAFAGSITAPGSYTGTSLLFSDPSAAASESDFGSISFIIAENTPGFYDFSILGCLNTGSGCLVGNELTANFQIAAPDINSASAAAVGLDQPHPLDLLEDDGVTDIHGSIDTYSYSGTTGSQVPEPSSLVLISSALSIFGGNGLRRFAQRRR
jgi:hypothetical protein